MSAPLRLLVVMALLVAAAPQPAQADRRFDRLVADGAACRSGLNYGCALQKLREAEARLTAQELDLSVAQRLALYRELALTYAAIEGHEEDARAAFGTCFELDPAFRLPADIDSPKILGHYRAARQALLSRLVQGTPRAADLPDPYPARPPTPADLRLHVPTEVVLGGQLDPTSSLAHRLDVLAGAHLLFGEDAENFRPGFMMELAYLYSVTEHFSLGPSFMFGQHAYARDDLKAEFPGTLYIFNGGVTARYRFPIGDWVELSTGLSVGVSSPGLGTIGGRIGGWGALRFAAMITPAREFAFGLAVLPTLVMAGLDSGDLGYSFSLPILVRLEARF